MPIIPVLRQNRSARPLGYTVKKQRFTKKRKKTNNSASSGETSASLTEPPTPWLRQRMREVQQIHSQGSNVRKLNRMAQWVSACPASVKTRVQRLRSHETVTQAWKPAYNYSLRSQRPGSPRARLLVRQAASVR